MQTLVNVIIATATALMVPGVTSDSYQLNPTPLVVAQIVQQPEVIEKVVPNRATTTSDVACNCYNLLTENFEVVPRMKTIQNTATSSFGSVAVFKYPPNEDWPEGIPHVAVTTGSTTLNSFEIEEYNFKECVHSYRFVSFNDVRLVGFIDL